jgi:hypothetical protein
LGYDARIDRLHAWHPSGGKPFATYQRRSRARLRLIPRAQARGGQAALASGLSHYVFLGRMVLRAYPFKNGYKRLKTFLNVYIRQ